MDNDITKYVVQYSLNPNLRPARDKMFSFIILKVLSENESALSINILKERIISKYNIKLPDIILNDTLDELTDVGKVEFELNSATYKINGKMKEKLGEFENAYAEKFIAIKQWFLEEIKSKYKDAIPKSVEESLANDLIVKLGKIIEYHSRRIKAENLEYVNLKCDAKDISQDLKKNSRRYLFRTDKRIN
jgi:hypothetical protein